MRCTSPHEGAGQDSLSALARRVLLATFCLVTVLVVVLVGAPQSALALDAIALQPDQERTDVSLQGQFIEGRGDNIQIETAAGTDGTKGRMAIRAATPGTNPNWLVFAVRNPTDVAIERWLVVERYTLIGSGIVWPDLDAKRIEAVTPSIGFLPERVKSDKADIFRISVEPKQTVTYAVELASDRFPKVELWAPLVYELRARDRQLFNGIMLGITGVLGIFLTAVFAANHKAIFPCAALLTWCVLAYLCVDFGFWHKLFQLRAEDNAVYRAATESAVAASFVVFLHVFLRLGAWYGFIRMLLGVWIVAQLSLVAIAVIDPRLAATFARASFGAIGGMGMVLILALTLVRQDRALALLPTWILFLVWIFAAGMTLTGDLAGPIVGSSLVAGLVLIVVLVGFAVTQFAFRSIDTMDAIAPTEQQLRSLAIEGSGAAVWEWNARRQEIKVSPVIEASLGLKAGVLSTKVDDFLMYLHDADRERFRLMLWSAQERGGGELLLKFRMRHADGSSRWFDLEAAAVKSSDRRSLRCVGLMRDITESKRAHEQMLYDAVHDGLTGLPNRELFLDRVSQALIRGRNEGRFGQTVLFIDIDKFKSANSSFGPTIGDSLLLTVAKRLEKQIGPYDTIGRVAGDQFAILFVEPEDIAGMQIRAERIRRSLRAPIRISGQDVVLTASIGVVIADGAVENGVDLLRDAEIAMYRAKRAGADKVEFFLPEYRNDEDDRSVVEHDLRRALEQNEIQVLYQPIIYLATEELAGFEAKVRWQHPKIGLIDPSEFVPIAEQSDLIVRLGSYVLNRAVVDAARWHKELPRSEKQLFVSVNVSSRRLLRPELIQEIRQIVGRQHIPPSTLKLEITESLVMENPEQATEALEVLKATGASLTLDDFGTGYSSLSYLQRFPIDTLKIDRDLVQGGEEGPGSAIVRSIVAFSHELGKKVVAEGAETSSDVGFLRSIGCEYAQGVYYGPAISMNEVLKFIRLVARSERKLQRRGLFTVNTKKKSTRRNDVVRPVPAANGIEPAQTAAGRPQADIQNPRVGLPGELAGAGSFMRTRTRRPGQDRIPSNVNEAARDTGGRRQTHPPALPPSIARTSPPAGWRKPPAIPPVPAAATTAPTRPQSMRPRGPVIPKGLMSALNAKPANDAAGKDATTDPAGTIASVLAQFGQKQQPPKAPTDVAAARERKLGRGLGLVGNDEVVTDLGRALSGQSAPARRATGTPAANNDDGGESSRTSTLPPALARSLEKLAGEKKS